MGRDADSHSSPNLSPFPPHFLPSGEVMPTLTVSMPDHLASAYHCSGDGAVSEMEVKTLHCTRTYLDGSYKPRALLTIMLSLLQAIVRNLWQKYLQLTPSRGKHF